MEIERTRCEERAVTCAVPRGAVLAMKPLILHASAPAQNPKHRRVIHIEYAAQELPHRLEWFDRVKVTG